MLVELQKALLMPDVLPKKSHTCMQAIIHSTTVDSERHTQGRVLRALLNMVIVPHVCAPLIVLQCQL